MKHLAIAAALFLSAGAPASAATGMDLFNTCGTGFKAGFLNRDGCHGYILGMMNGLAAAREICVPPGTVDTQGVMVVQAFMREHPERLSEEENQMVTEALERAWPCD